MAYYTSMCISEFFDYFIFFRLTSKCEIFLFYVFNNKFYFSSPLFVTVFPKKIFDTFLSDSAFYSDDVNTFSYGNHFSNGGGVTALRSPRLGFGSSRINKPIKYTFICVYKPNDSILYDSTVGLRCGLLTAYSVTRVIILYVYII